MIGGPAHKAKLCLKSDEKRLSSHINNKRRSAAVSLSISKSKPLALLLLLPLLAACDQATSAIPPPERPVEVARVAFQAENASRDFVGVVQARHETDLAFRVAGKI